MNSTNITKIPVKSDSKANKSLNDLIRDRLTDKNTLKMIRYIDRFISFSILDRSFRRPSDQSIKYRDNLETQQSKDFVKLFKKRGKDKFSFQSYIKRLIIMGEIPIDLLQASFVLFGRVVQHLKKVKKAYKLSSLKLFAVALFIQQKLVYDEKTWFVEEFSLIAGLSAEKLPSMELCMLEIVDYKLYVSFKDTLNLKKQILLSIL